MAVGEWRMMSDDILLLFCRRMMILSRSGHGHAVVRDEKKMNADKSQRRRRLCMFEGRGGVNHAGSPECGVQDRRREFKLPQVRSDHRCSCVSPLDVALLVVTMVPYSSTS